MGRQRQMRRVVIQCHIGEDPSMLDNSVDDEQSVRREFGFVAQRSARRLDKLNAAAKKVRS